MSFIALNKSLLTNINVRLADVPLCNLLILWDLFLGCNREGGFGYLGDLEYESPGEPRAQIFLQQGPATLCTKVPSLWLFL